MKMILIFHLSLTPSCLYFSSSSFLQPKPQIGLNKILKVLELSFSVVTGQPSSLTTYQIVHLMEESAKSLGTDGHNKGLFAFPRQFSQSISLQSQQKTKHSPPPQALLETRFVIKNNRQRVPSKWNAEKQFDASLPLIFPRVFVTQLKDVENRGKMKSAWHW